MRPGPRPARAARGPPAPRRPAAATGSGWRRAGRPAGAGGQEGPSPEAQDLQALGPPRARRSGRRLRGPGGEGEHGASKPKRARPHGCAGYWEPRLRETMLPTLTDVPRLGAALHLLARIYISKHP